jgi:hypothetical protein
MTEIPYPNIPMDMGIDSPISKKRSVANAIANTLDLGSDVGNIAISIPDVSNGFLVFVQSIGHFLLSFLQIFGHTFVIIGHVFVVISQVSVQILQVVWAILEPLLKVIVAILSCLK